MPAVLPPADVAARVAGAHGCDPAFIRRLRCPYCGDALEPEGEPPAAPIEWGVIRCGCYRYPVLGGIPVLRQLAGPSERHDPLVSALEHEGRAAALHLALAASSMVWAAGNRWSRLTDVARQRPVARGRAMAHLLPGRALRRLAQADLPLREALTLIRPSLYAQYLFHRYANPSFLASVGPALLLGSFCRQSSDSPTPTVLDLGCGIGHSSFLLRALFPAVSVIATDHDFVNLFLARRYIAGDTTFVCVDADAPLPFATDEFDGIHCLDAFHYFRSKRALARELARVARPGAAWVFPHLHNAAGENFSPGTPLTLAGYRRCFDFLTTRILPESDVLRQFVNHRAIDLTPEGSPFSSDIPAFTMFGSRDPRFFRRYQSLDAPLMASPERLRVNPVYRVRREAGIVQLTLSWPSPRLAAECAAASEYLPATASVDAQAWDRLTTGVVNGADGALLADLVRQFVLVPLPHGYTPQPGTAVES